MRPAKRPGFFFREDGEERRRGEGDRRPRGWSKTPLPGAVVWELALPPGFESADELQRQVRVALDEKLARIQDDRRKAGKRAVLGAATVLAQPILATPASTEELFRLNPRLAYRDWTRKAQACSGWLAWRIQFDLEFHTHVDRGLAVMDQRRVLIRGGQIAPKQEAGDRSEKQPNAGQTRESHESRPTMPAGGRAV